MTLAGFVGLAWIFITALPTLANAVMPVGADRHAVLDGFRGLLAISVVLHHGILMRRTAMGQPLSSLEPYEIFLGRGAVAFFFMASAALFVGQVMRHGGRLSLRHFVAGRVRRILPLYLVAVAGVLAAVTWEAGGIEAPVGLARDAGKWLLFDFVTRPDLNGIAHSADYLGTVWSLRYEWMLYVALPFLAFAYRCTSHRGTVYAGLTLLAVPVHLFALFLAGAAALPASQIRHRHADAVIAMAAVGGIVAALLTLNEFASLRAAPLLFPTFVLVLRRRSRLVTWMAAAPVRYLGQISFSVYLLHGPAVMLLSRHSDLVRFWMIGDPIWFAALMGLVFVALLALSSATYLLIERPFQVPGLVSGKAIALAATLGRLVTRPTHTASVAQLDLPAHRGDVAGATPMTQALSATLAAEVAIA